jgi:serpin B
MKKLLNAFAFATLALSPLSAHEPEPPADKALLASAINDFGMRLYAEDATGEGNACISPVSVSMALLMALMGAEGETADELVRVLGLIKADAQWQPDRVQQALSALMADLKASKGSAQLNIVNDMWGQQGYGFLKSYRQQLLAAGSRLHELDFSKNPEQARVTINSYIKKETGDRIENLIPQGSITSAVRQVLTNAVYLKARWQRVFSSSNTLAGAFTLPNGKEIKVPMMHQQGEFDYADNDQLQVLRMGYEHSSYEMILVLPRAGEDMDVARAALQPSALKTWLATSKSRRIKVALPKFELHSSYDDMSEALKRMGLNVAFDAARSDFSGVNGGVEPLPLDRIMHKTFLKVHEEGAEAAAATAITKYGGRIRDPRLPVVFAANRSFALAIRDSRTNSLLFVGQITDPRSE